MHMKGGAPNISKYGLLYILKYCWQHAFWIACSVLFYFFQFFLGHSWKALEEFIFSKGKHYSGALQERFSVGASVNSFVVWSCSSGSSTRLLQAPFCPALCLSLSTTRGQVDGILWVAIISRRTEQMVKLSVLLVCFIGDECGKLLDVTAGR